MQNLDILNRVAEFHLTFQSPVLLFPQIPTEDRAKLRISLIEEEFNELKEAIEQKDLTGVIDALCDLQYVLSGTVLEFGLGDIFNDCLREVHRSNMSKLCTYYSDAVETVNHYAEKGISSQILPCGHRFLIQRTPDLKTLKSIRYSPASFVKTFELSNDYVWLGTDSYIAKDGSVKDAICIEGRYFALIDDLSAEQEKN